MLIPLTFKVDLVCYRHYVTGFTYKDGVSGRQKRPWEGPYLLHALQQQEQEGPKQEVRD